MPSKQPARRLKSSIKQCRWFANCRGGIRLKTNGEGKQGLIRQGKEHNEIASSQLRRDSRINNLDKLISRVGSIPEYNPNETELQLSSLTSMLDNLRAGNNNAINATTPLSNIRIDLNEIRYRERTGLADTAMNVKSYAKSVFAANSSCYHQIFGLDFKKVCSIC